MGVEETFYSDAACATLSTKQAVNPVSFENGVCNNQLGFPVKLKWDANIGCGTTMAATTVAKQVSAGQLSALSSSVPISNISQTILYVLARGESKSRLNLVFKIVILHRLFNIFILLI